jgi:hypothetical protein
MLFSQYDLDLSVQMGLTLVREPLQRVALFPKHFDQHIEYKPLENLHIKQLFSKV